MRSVRLAVILAVFRRELRETLRDRRSLVAMFGIPVVLYPGMMLGTAGLMQSAMRKAEGEPTRVAIVGEADVLSERLASSESEFEVVEAPRDFESALRDKTVDAVLEAPDGEEGEFRLLLDRTKPKAQVAERRVRDAVDEYEEAYTRERLGAYGAPESLADPFQVETEDVAEQADVAGRMLGFLVPMLLLMNAALAAFYPAVGSITTERESGLAEVLLVTPARRAEILAGKVALIALTALAGALVNLGGMALTGARLGAALAESGVGFALDPGRLALAFVVSVPAVLFVASSVLLVACLARTYREAGHYATPVMLLASLPSFIVMADTETTLRLAALPVAGAALLVRDVLMGEARGGPILLSAAVHLACAWLLLLSAVRAYAPERWESRGWSPLTRAGLRALLRRRSEEGPSQSEAVAAVVLSSLLMFYLGDRFLNLGFLSGVALPNALLVGVPGLLFALLSGRRATRVLSLRRPTGNACLAAALIGLGMPGVSLLIAFAMERLLGPSEGGFAELGSRLVEAMRAQPLATLAAIALVPAVCEECLFRGGVLAGLRRMGIGRAVVLNGILFAAAHFEWRGLPSRALLGMGLAYIVLATGSLWPAVILHAANNAVALALAAYVGGGADAASTADWITGGPGLAWFGVGCACVAAGAWLLPRPNGAGDDADPKRPE